MISLLVINSGSSSIKFAFWHGPKLVLRGSVDGFGQRARLSVMSSAGQALSLEPIPDAKTAISVVHRLLQQKAIQPNRVAHRIVHGGWAFDRPVELTAARMRQLRQLIPLAPLHMPINLAGVAQTEKFWPKASQWGVFDTAIYRTLPEYARMYALPLAITNKFHIQKYGFHGISHQWAARQASTKLRANYNRLNAVSLHLGSGDSLTLWKNGRAADTSMGFTPLEGLAMATRAGDLDPTIPLFLLRHGYSLGRVETLLQHQSGLFGLTGLTDMRDILSAAGHPVTGWPRRRWTNIQRRQAKLAVDIFIYDIERYLGSYLSQLSYTAPMILTGSIGANRYIQQRIRSLPVARGRRLIYVPADEESAIAVAVGHVVP